MQRLLITGGSGFIGSNFILRWLAKNKNSIIVNLDNLTYAGNNESLTSIEKNPNYRFIKGSINNKKLVTKLFKSYTPTAIINFAAESHVDRSIKTSEVFFKTNVLGTLNLLEISKEYWEAQKNKNNFRFLHISTDEVFGSLNPEAPTFNESSPYRPNSPYSASKAASDHIVRSYSKTYNLPTLTTNCSNNFGPRQHPEKLIPNTILKALEKKSIPIYGTGKQVRDWLYVEDHCDALEVILKNSAPGEVYNIGGVNEMTNLDLVHTICETLDKLKPQGSGLSHTEYIKHIEDRKGHDQRYAVDVTKIKNELYWQPNTNFLSALRETIIWYLKNESWIKNTNR